MKLIVIAFLGLLFNVSVAQDLDEVLAAHFKASNQDAILKLKGMYMLGKSGRMGQEFKFEMWQKRSAQYKMVVDIQGQQMIQLFDGEHAYMVAPWTGSLDPQEMGPTETEQLKERADIDGDLWNWKEKGSVLSYEGEDELEGSEVYLLKLIKKNKDEVTYYLDADSYLPIKVVTKTQMQGSQVSIETYMSNYKDVDGIVMAHYIENRMNDQVMSTVSIDSINLNPDIPEDFFKKPESPKTAETVEEKK